MAPVSRYHGLVNVSGDAVVSKLPALLHPLIQAKLQTARNTQKLQALKLADELAGVIIPELAKMTELAPQQRKAEAIQFINQHLKTLGLSLTDETLAAKVEQAYHNYQRPPS
ncbi:MAG: phage holin, LLH family [Lentilactobacillus diolivorans]